MENERTYLLADNNRYRFGLFSSIIGGAKFRSIEWSDGKLSSLDYNGMTFVQRCPFTGRYLLHDEYKSTFGDNKGFFSVRKLTFNELYDAFRQFEEEKNISDYNRLALLWEAIHSYNDTYWRSCKDEKPSQKEFIRFVDLVLEMQKYPNNDVPLSIKADLYREIGLFPKVLSLYDKYYYDISGEEKEIFDEVVYLASKGVCSPFVIEDIPHYADGLRRRNRTCVARFYVSE